MATKHSLALNASDRDGNCIHNQILLRLPRKEREIVFPKLELVRLKARQVLHEAGDTLRSVYFCNAGMISIQIVFPDGKSLGIGLVGKEGFVGTPLIAGFASSATRAVVQAEASALRLSADALGMLLCRCPEFEQELQQSSQIMAMEAGQISACNQLHEDKLRLVRWLLTCADRMGNTLPLTHELLAQMLGTRRATVTIAVGILQRANLISCSRGSVQIVDRAGLETLACECHRMMERQKQRWRSESTLQLLERVPIRSPV